MKYKWKKEVEGDGGSGNSLGGVESKIKEFFLNDKA